VRSRATATHKFKALAMTASAQRCMRASPNGHVSRVRPGLLAVLPGARAARDWKRTSTGRGSAADEVAEASEIEKEGAWQWQRRREGGSAAEACCRPQHSGVEDGEAPLSAVGVARPC
jgi:hypothetical protein